MSLRKNPYSYTNIAITSVVIFLFAVIVGRISIIPLETADTDAALIRRVAVFLWQFSRDLMVPICLLILFVCISNVVLLIKEGYRLHNLLGFIFGSMYLVGVNLLWKPISTLPDVLNPVLILIRLIVCYLECTFLAICVMGYLTAKREPEYDRDYCIILGCSISKKGKLRPLIKGRVNRAIHYAWEQEIETGHSMVYIPSGGQGPDEPISEGSAMEMYLISHGAEEYEVFAEKESRNTLENLLYSKIIIERLEKERGRNVPEGRDAAKEPGIKGRVAIVTSDFHVLRSGLLSRRAGLDAIVVGCNTKWYFWPNAFLRETIAILVMFPRIHLSVALLFAVFSALILFF
ncbi:MAG: YdcF family protein [Lachnospiraceae bacterium]|nr:YdcF family protein [Lachnospiraceae bacterium]